jgi:tetratricopeptide (TPR) repeat protein
MKKQPAMKKKTTKTSASKSRKQVARPRAAKSAGSRAQRGDNRKSPPKSRRAQVPPPVRKISPAPAAPRPASGASQTEFFEKAIALFNSGDFSSAKGVFERAALGGDRQMAHSARLHARICEHRIKKQVPELSSAEDRYNYAVALINRRDLATAESELRAALIQSEHSDHLHYALALCRGLNGDLEGAYTHLKRAIELQPRNRLVARNDPDFSEFGHRLPVRDLLFPERR